MEKLFQWEYVIKYFPKLMAALPTTLGLVVGAAVIGTIVGFLLAFVRIERIPILRQISTILTSFLRDTPVLIQLFLVYYALPILLWQVFGINVNSWNRLIFVIIAFGLNTAGLFSEIFRGAVLSVPNSQRDAARSIGMTKRQMYQRIILPQTIRVILPPYGTVLVGLLQDTAVAFTLGIIDIMGKVKSLGALYYHTLEGYFDAALIFIVLSILIEQLFAFLDARLVHMYNPLDTSNIVEKRSLKKRYQAYYKKIGNQRKRI